MPRRVERPPPSMRIVDRARGKYSAQGTIHRARAVGRMRAPASQEIRQHVGMRPSGVVPSGFGTACAPRCVRAVIRTPVPDSWPGARGILPRPAPAAGRGAQRRRISGSAVRTQASQCGAPTPSRRGSRRYLPPAAPPIRTELVIAVRPLIARRPVEAQRNALGPGVPGRRTLQASARTAASSRRRMPPRAVTASWPDRATGSSGCRWNSAMAPNVPIAQPAWGSARCPAMRFAMFTTELPVAAGNRRSPRG